MPEENISLVKPPKTIWTSVFSQKPKPKYWVKYEVSQSEEIDIVENAGFKALYLYQKYVRWCCAESPYLEDALVATQLSGDWTERSVADTRRALTRLGYFKAVHYTRPDGVKKIDYVLGKKAVAACNPKKQTNPS